MPALYRKWSPHPAQAQIFHDDSRFRIVAAGRRFGKTEMCDHLCIDYAWENPESLVWWVAPTYNDAKELGYDRIEKMLPASIVKRKSAASPPTIELVNGSVLSFRSADREDSLRGRGVDFLVIDEAGSVADRAWQNELRPALSDTMGDLVAIGTPKGRNWFFNEFKRGEDGVSADIASFHFSTYDNPYVPDSEVELARSTLPERVFKQEYLAEFIDDEGAVFGPVRERNVVPGYRLGSREGVAPFRIGVDLGRAEDFTAVVTLDAEGWVVGSKRTRGGSWATLQASVEAQLQKYTPATVFIDATRDNKVVEDIQRSAGGYARVEPVRFTSRKKTEMVENLAARLEMEDIHLPDPDVDDEAAMLVNELEVFEYEVLDSGNIRYQAPAGMHDDYVDALALANSTPEQPPLTRITL